jgi:acetylornithine deacetylase/succinyl-diaminopimelate desuccinylase-like protein
VASGLLHPRPKGPCMYSSLREDVERLSDEVVGFTRELVRTPSLSLHEGEVAAKVQDMMRDLSYDLAFTDEAGNVVGVVAGGDPLCTVLLESHMDTAVLDSPSSWSYPPLAAEMADDRIVGLGAAECKASLAAQVFAGHVLARRLAQPHVNIVVAAVVAEENGCAIGTRHLLSRTLPNIGCSPMLCLLGEPTGLDVCFGHDGWACIDLDIVARQPAVATCAAEIVHRELIRHCDSNGWARADTVMTAEPPVMSVAPDGTTCRLRVFRRLFQGEVIDEIVQWIAAHVSSELEGLQPLAIDVHVHEEEQELYTGRRSRVAIVTPPWSTKLIHPTLDCVRDSLLNAGLSWNPRHLALKRLGRGTAGSVLSVEFGLPAICFGPGDEAQVSSPDESVGVAELVEAVVGLTAIVSGLNRSCSFRRSGP